MSRKQTTNHLGWPNINFDTCYNININNQNNGTAVIVVVCFSRVLDLKEGQH